MKKLVTILLLCSLSLAEVVISPNMNLPVPIVGTTPGPTWANNINSCMSSIDEHDHTPGKGVPISSSAISLNSNLPLNNNALTSVQAVSFTSQASFSGSQSLYVESPDLFYNDGNGNIIRITQSGSVSGASGTITGLPSGTASASYQAVGGTFQFQSATNTPANITGASISIAQQTATPNSITFKSPNSLAASYNVTWPTTVPSYASLLTMSTSGVLSTVPYLTPTIQKFTSSTGTYTLPTGPAPIYIKVKMCGAGGGGSGGSNNAGSAGGNSTFGTTLLVANGGSGGPGNAGNTGGAGGTASLGAAIGVAVTGQAGGGAGTTTASAAKYSGTGGSSALFGGGGPAKGQNNEPGVDGVTNTGGGGSGGVGDDSPLAQAGVGGGAGGCVDAIINSPTTTYSYAVGAGGAGGATDGSTGAGGAGAAGIIVVEEHYQ